MTDFRLFMDMKNVIIKSTIAIIQQKLILYNLNKYRAMLGNFCVIHNYFTRQNKQNTQMRKHPTTLADFN